MYLRRKQSLNLIGIKNNRNYLLSMFFITISTNLVIFYLIFPATSKFNNKPVSAKTTVQQVSLAQDQKIGVLDISVDIPCSGHSFLIQSEVKKLQGIKSVDYSLPNKFKITFDKKLLTKEKILALPVFQTYKAKEL
jgi:hypothetical protein